MNQPTSFSARLPAILGLGAIVVLVGGIGSWAVGTEISGAVVASGTVRVESDRQVIQHRDGGLVKTILVRDGDRVTAGDVLVRFDDTFLRSELEIIDRQLLEIHARKARLEAERDGLVTLSIPVPVEFVHLDADWVRDHIRGQITLFEARLSAKMRESEQIGEQQHQIERQIEGLQAQLDAVTEQHGLLENELSDQNALHQKGLVPVSRVTDLKRERSRIRGEIGRFSAAIGEAGARIAAFEIARANLANQRREQAVAALRDLRFAEIELAERRLITRERLARMDVRAPVGGTVFASRVQSRNSVVEAADPMMFIVPGDTPLQVVAHINPLDIDQVQPGQPAMLRFPSFSRGQTPFIDGKVLRISADSVSDYRTGRTYFEAVVEIVDPDGALSDDLAILPGMPAEVFLETGSRSPMSYLANPFAAYLSRAFREG